MLTLTNGSDSVDLHVDEVRALEIKLNVTSKSIAWRKIGDFLYDYHIGRTPDLPTPILKVDTEQFLFLLRLISMPTWRDCSGL
jgi:hypothetical protein